MPDCPDCDDRRRIEEYEKRMEEVLRQFDADCTFGPIDLCAIVLFALVLLAVVLAIVFSVP